MSEQENRSDWKPTVTFRLSWLVTFANLVDTQPVTEEDVCRWLDRMGATPITPQPAPADAATPAWTPSGDPWVDRQREAPGSSRIAIASPQDAYEVLSDIREWLAPYGESWAPWQESLLSAMVPALDELSEHLFGPADAVTEAAVRAARLDWEACQAKYAPYGSEWFWNPLEGDGYLRRRIMKDGLWLAFGKPFEPAYMAEARRLSDAGESEVRG